jgi:hypothetical protein
MGVNGRFTRDKIGAQRALSDNGEALQSQGFKSKPLKRATRIELAFSAWKSGIIML